ncbi:MAG: DUF3667 domain-containing protein [Crocinitomicaceae bacterium]
MILSNFLEIFTNFHGPVWNTLRALTISPYDVTNGYIIGQRKKYIPPARFVIISLTISGLFFLFFKDDMASYYEQTFNNGAGTGSRDSGVSEARDQFQSLLNKGQKHLNLMSYLMIPILGLFSYWMLNKKVKYNFAEHLVVNSYIFSHNSIIGAVLGLVIYYCLGKDLDLWLSISIIPSFAIMAWLLKKSVGAPLWKVIITLLLSYISFMLLFAIAVIVYLVISSGM